MRNSVVAVAPVDNGAGAVAASIAIDLGSGRCRVGATSRCPDCRCVVDSNPDFDRDVPVAAAVAATLELGVALPVAVVAGDAVPNVAVVLVAAVDAAPSAVVGPGSAAVAVVADGAVPSVPAVPDSVAAAVAVVAGGAVPSVVAVPDSGSAAVAVVAGDVVPNAAVVPAAVAVVVGGAVPGVAVVPGSVAAAAHRVLVVVPRGDSVAPGPVVRYLEHYRRAHGRVVLAQTQDLTCLWQWRRKVRPPKPGV